MKADRASLKSLNSSKSLRTRKPRVKKVLRSEASGDTRDRALKLAQRYLQTLGFAGFSFQTLADELGIRKASLHYHFASKEVLGIALVQKYIDEFRAWAERQEQRSASEGLESLKNLFIEISDGSCRICPIGSLSGELQTLPRKLKSKVLELHQLERDWLSQILRTGETLKNVKLRLSPDATSEALLSAALGSLQIARLRQDSKLVGTVFESLCQSLVQAPRT